MTDPATPSIELPTDDTPIREAAVMYSRAGFAPVPVYGVQGDRCGCGNASCTAVGKHPVGGNWQKRAKADADVARELFGGHLGNIGIVVGSQFVVIDVDYYHDGKAGLATLPAMPPTLTSRSGSGEGEHRIFAYAPGQDPNEVTNRAIASGVDIKTRTGQIVVAPSLHRSGKHYQWIDTSPPAPLPDALYERIRKNRVIPIRTSVTQSSGDTIERRARAYVGAIPPGIEGAGGGTAAFRVSAACWAWIDKGLDRGTARSIFEEYLATCSPPWTDTRQIEHKWEQGRNANRPVIIEDKPGAKPPPVDDPDWRSRLIFQRSKSGPDKPATHHENAVIVLRYCPAWRGRLYFDEHAQRVMVTSPPWHDSDAPATSTSTPREWTDADSARLSSWIRREVFSLSLSISDCDRAVQIAAEANPRHPFREYIEALAWDGTERLADWLRLCLGAAQSRYIELVGAWWLIAAVARTYQPGCKVDTVLILEGEQGIRKSSALRSLVGAQWFTDTPIDLQSKDAYLALQGRVIVELGELESLRKADADRAKVFFSSPVDQFRPPYGKRTISIPRGCVFAGSVNHSVYLTDDTGNRRYWPVRCGTIDLDFLSSIRDQLWAEAVTRYKEGARWWPEGVEEHDMCASEQVSRAEVDSWGDVIATYAHGRDEITVTDVWKDALKAEIDKLDRRSEMRISRALRDAGLHRKRVGPRSDRRWVYVR